MSILNTIFGTKPAAPATPAQQQGAEVPQQQGNIPAAPTVASNPNNPTAPVTPAPTEAENNDPLAGFKNLWDNEPKTGNEGETEPAPLTAEQLQKAMANANFSSGITPEMMQAISAGGDEATQAFQNAMNNVAKQVMVQATLVNNKLTEKAVADAIAKQQALIPDLVRKQATTAHVNDTNPLFSNPAIKPVVEATQSQLLAKFPNATPAEITKMTQDYISAMGKAFMPQQTVNDNGAGETDWDKFLQS